MMIGIGSDIISVGRIRKVFLRHASFPGRILARSEKRTFEERKSSMEFLAGRFAAKEAVLKALGTGLRAGITFKDIEITGGPSGALTVSLHGKAIKALADAGGNRVLITISHEKDYAVAFAAVEGPV